VDIRILEGSFGCCQAKLAEKGIETPAAFIPFEDILELSIAGLDMTHDSMPKISRGMDLGSLFGGPTLNTAGNAWLGDTLEVTFMLKTHAGIHLLAKTENETFLRLKEAFIGNEKENAAGT
jgi:hypothetical protein